MERKVGQLDKAISWVQFRKKRVIRPGDLQQALALTQSQERRLLTYLCSRQLFVKITKGLYLAPNRLPPAGWAPSPFISLYLLMQELKAEYQISGLFAFNRYQLSTQIPQVYTVYNTSLSFDEKVVGKSRFQFIKVSKERLGETEFIKISEEGFQELEISVASLPRTLFDAIYDYNRYASLPDAYTWLKKYRHDEKTIKKLIEITKEFGNVGTKRRIGFVLSELGVSEKVTSSLLMMLPKTSSLIPLVPNQPERGSINRKWGIINNGANLPT